MTKPAIHSKELWATFIYASFESMHSVIEQEQFKDVFGEYMWIVRLAYPIVMAALRVFRTEAKIEGVFRTPDIKIHPPTVNKENSKNRSVTDVLEDEIGKNDLDNF